MEFAIVAITVIFWLGVLTYQRNQHRFIEQQSLLGKKIVESGQIDQLKEEFNDYKKRVDTLMLKSGFKL